MTLPVGSIIIKLDIDNQITSAINPCEAMNYIDYSHDKCLRYRRYVREFFITLFGEAVY